MAKASKKNTASRESLEGLVKPVARRQLHSIQVWKCHHHFDCSEIELYSELTGRNEFNISITGENHIALAEFVAHAANERNQSPNLLNDALNALEQCLSSGALRPDEERLVDKIILRAAGGLK
jgi:hypothetical protein